MPPKRRNSSTSNSSMLSSTSMLDDIFNSPAVKKKGRNSSSESKGKNSRRQTIDPADLENLENLSGTSDLLHFSDHNLSKSSQVDFLNTPVVGKRGRQSTGLSGSKGKNRRQTIDPEELKNLPELSDLPDLLKEVEQLGVSSSNLKKNFKRRETIEADDLLQFNSSSFLSGKSDDSVALKPVEVMEAAASMNRKKKDTRRETIEVGDLLHFDASSLLSSKSDASSTALLTTEVTETLNLKKNDRRETIEVGDLLQFNPSSFLSNKSNESVAIQPVELIEAPVSVGVKKKDDRRQTIDVGDLLHFNSSSFLSNKSDTSSSAFKPIESIAAPVPAKISREMSSAYQSVSHEMEETDDLSEQSNQSLQPLENLLKIGGDLSPLNLLDDYPTTTSQQPPVAVEPRLSSSSWLLSNHKEDQNRRETIDPIDLNNLSFGETLTTLNISNARRETVSTVNDLLPLDASKSNATIDTMDIRGVIDALDTTPGTIMTEVSLGEVSIESTQSLLPLENFLQIGSPIRTTTASPPPASTAKTGTTATTLAPPAILSSALKSCLSVKKAPKEVTMNRSVVFGSPQAMEFRHTSPTNKYTPLDKSQAKAMFAPVVEESNVSEVDEVTAENEKILEEWDRLTQASSHNGEYSPEVFPTEEDFPFEDIGADDINVLSPNRSIASLPSRVSSAASRASASSKRRQSMMQPRVTAVVDSVPMASSFLDEPSQVTEVTATVQLPGTLSQLMEEVSREESKLAKKPGEASDEYDDHTEEIETDLRALLHHIDEKHSFIDLRMDSSVSKASASSASSSHLSDDSACEEGEGEVSLVDFAMNLSDSNHTRSGSVVKSKSPRKSIMSEIFAVDSSPAASSHPMEEGEVEKEQPLNDLQQLYQSRLSTTSSQASSAQHSILSHLQLEIEPSESQIASEYSQSSVKSSVHSESHREVEMEAEVSHHEVVQANNPMGFEIFMDESMKKDQAEEEEQDEEESEGPVEEELSFVGKKVKALLMDIPSPARNRKSLHQAVIIPENSEVADKSQILATERQQLESLRSKIHSLVNHSFDAGAKSSSVGLPSLSQRVADRLDKTTTVPLPSLSTRAFTPHLPSSSFEASLSETVSTPVPQVSTADWQTLFRDYWLRVAAITQEIATLAVQSFSAHRNAPVFYQYTRSIVKENFVVAAKCIHPVLSRFLLSHAIEGIWERCLTTKIVVNEDYYHQQVGGETVMHLIESMSQSDYDLLSQSLPPLENDGEEDRSSSSWDNIWVDLIQASLFEGTIRMRQKDHEIIADKSTSESQPDRFLSKALDISTTHATDALNRSIMGSATSSKVNHSDLLLDQFLRAKKEKQKYVAKLRDQEKELSTLNNILNRSSFFRVVALLADLVEVHLLLSEDSYVDLQFHLSPSGSDGSLVIENISIDLSFSSRLLVEEKAFLGLYFAEVLASETNHGPLSPSVLGEVRALSQIPTLLDQITGHILVTRAALAVIKKIKILDGSFQILRDTGVENSHHHNTTTSPQIYIEYSHSQYPVTMSLMAFISYSQRRSYLFVESQDSMVLFLKDLREFLSI